MIQIKAMYYRYRHQICFSSVLIVVGISFLIWWQVSQSSSSMSSKDITTISAHQNIAKKSKKSKKLLHDKQSKKVVIDVKGAVYRPGVYYFAKEPIVAEVLRSAGGPLPNVDNVRINLAATLNNGQVLYVPVENEQVPEAYPLPGNPAHNEQHIGQASDQGNSNDKINLNTADSATLQNLPGIGEKRAQDIIKQRETMGGFKTISDLQQVNGIGEKTFAKLEPLVTV